MKGATVKDFELNSSENNWAAISDVVSHDQIKGEEILFKGDVALTKSTFKVLNGQGVCTDQRFIFLSDGEAPIALLKTDIRSVEEGKNGLAMTWSVTTAGGEEYDFQAINSTSMRRAMAVLTGREVLDEPSSPESTLAYVENKTAWLAAFGPVLTDVLVLLLATALSNVEYSTIFYFWIFKFAFMYLLMRVDYLSLQRQGYTPAKLGVVLPENLPVYLFSRAKAFHHSRGYAYVWAILLALDLGIALDTIFF